MHARPTTRRSFLAGLSALSLASKCAFASSPRLPVVFVGTTTRGKSTSKGIYAYRWDTASGTLSALGLAAETESPTFLTISPNRRYLYAVNEVRDYRGNKDGSVSSFSLDSTSVGLTLKNTVSSGGAGPCHVSVDHTGKVVFVADGAGGSLTSYRVLPDGSLSDPVSNLHFTGHSVNPIRQKGAYTHCTTVSPDNRFIVVNDLGLDHITTFLFDHRTAVLKPASSSFYQAVPGSGPRGFTFHPNRRWAYSVNEMLTTVDTLAWDSRQGTLTRIQNLSTLPPEFSGINAPATVQADRKGRFLYLSNRGANTIGVFSIDQIQGTLKQIQQVECGGSTPRHFTLDPTERWLLVANQASAKISILQRNSETGLLTGPSHQYDLDSPVCLVFG